MMNDHPPSTQVSECLESTCEEYDLADELKNEPVPTDVAMETLLAAFEKKMTKSDKKIMDALEKLEEMMGGGKKAGSDDGSVGDRPGVSFGGLPSPGGEGPRRTE